MSSWGNNDNAANTPLWSAASVNLEPTRTNATAVFDNSTVDAFKVTMENGGDRLADVAIGVFGISADEAAVDQKGAHTGWVKRTEFTGGRAGRVQEEVLVAMSSMNGDAEDTIYKDTVITITAQPATLRGPVDQASAQTTTFSVTASASPAAALSYQWQVNNNSGGSWVNIDPGTNVTTGQPGSMTKSGANTATLTLDPTGTAANNYVFRCVVTAAGTGATATSANGRILIV